MWRVFVAFLLLCPSVLAVEIDVTKFGAVSSDGKSDSAAFEAVFKAAKDGDTILIPAGGYNSEKPIDWTGKAVHIRANGATLTSTSSSGAAITIGGESGRERWRGSLEGLWVYSGRYDWHKGGPAVTGVRLQNVCGWRVDGLCVYGFATGIEWFGANASNAYSTCTNPVIFDCRVGMRASGDGANGWANRTVVTGGSWSTSSRIGREAPDAVVTCVELARPEVVPNIGSWVFVGPCWQAQKGSQTRWMDLKSAYLIDVYSPHCECGDQKPGAILQDTKTWGITVTGGVQTGIRWEKQ